MSTHECVGGQVDDSDQLEPRGDDLRFAPRKRGPVEIANGLPVGKLRVSNLHAITLKR
ncbi:MAG: hypothetical protein R3B90_08720 [Planctomycetaceae bacterium]